MNQRSIANKKFKYPCRNGANCREFKLGICIYPHDNVSISGNNGEELKASEININNNNNDISSQRNIT